MYKLIVLDTDKFCGESIKKILSMAEMDILFSGQVFDVQECLALLEKEKADIVLIDQSFGDEIKKNIDGKQVCFIGMTLTNTIEELENDEFFCTWIQKPIYPKNLISQLQILVTNIKMHLETNAVSENSKQQINWVLNYIKGNLNKDIRLETIANRVHFSTAYFSRIFKMTVGCSYSQYVIQLRIDTAKMLLAQTDRKIQSIAAEVGIDRINTFGKLFKDKVGLSPTAYRECSRKS